MAGHRGARALVKPGDRSSAADHRARWRDRSDGQRGLHDRARLGL